MKYQIIYADPPWKYENWSNEEFFKRGVTWARHRGRCTYHLMTTTGIKELPINDLCGKDCILFLWATFPKLNDAIDVMNAWGFTYKTVAFTWIKQTRNSNGLHYGLGHWTRGNPEICLLGTRGHPQRVSKSVPQVIISPLQEHSRKPDEARDRIVRLMGDLPRIELFARRQYEGWDCIGLEVDGKDINESLEERINAT